MQIVCIRGIHFELHMMKKKKKKNKIEIFSFDFLDCEERLWDSGTIFDLRIAKGFHL